MKIARQSPIVAAILSIAAIAICGAIWWVNLSGGNTPTGKWGYDLTTAELFKVPVTAVPPYDAPSGLNQGVDAQVFRDRNGKRIVVSLRRYTPEAAQVVHSIIAQQAMADARASMDTIHRGTLLRAVDETTWVEENSAAGTALMQANAARKTAEGWSIDLP